MDLLSNYAALQENGDGAIHVRPAKALARFVTAERTVRSSACLFHSPVVKVPPARPVRAIRRNHSAAHEATSEAAPIDSSNRRTQQMRSAQRGTYHCALWSVNGFGDGAAARLLPFTLLVLSRLRRGVADRRLGTRWPSRRC